MTVHVFWDIDGTLLTTARAGIFALEDAAVEVLGVEVDFSTMRTAGLTDAEIAIEVCRAHGREELHGAYLRAYGRLLPERLHRRRGEVLPNVRENLEALDARDDAVSLLLTGNIRAGAEAKLRHYGLWEFFARRPAAPSASRAPTARRSRARAQALAGDAYDGERTYVVGDTPHDISCGKVIGARTVAVATGPSYTLAELEACEPWVALEQLPAPEEFQQLVGLGAPPRTSGGSPESASGRARPH